MIPTEHQLMVLAVQAAALWLAVAAVVVVGLLMAGGRR